MTGRRRNLPPIDPSTIHIVKGGTEEQARALYGATGDDAHATIVELVGWDGVGGERRPRPIWRLRPRRKGEDTLRSPGDLGRSEEADGSKAAEIANEASRLLDEAPRPAPMTKRTSEPATDDGGMWVSATLVKVCRLEDDPVKGVEVNGRHDAGSTVKVMLIVSSKKAARLLVKRMDSTNRTKKVSTKARASLVSSFNLKAKGE